MKHRITKNEDLDSKNKLEFDDKWLPEGWIGTPLEYLICPSKEKFEPLDNESRTFIGLEHIEKNTGRIIGKGKTDNIRSTKTVFRAGDVLYGKLRPYLNKVCVPDFDGVCSTDILVFPKNQFLESSFLASFLSTSHFVTYTTANMKGVQHPRISFKKISEFLFPLPPLNEQKRIVAKIESIFSQIDAAKEKLERLALQISSASGSLAQLKSSVLKQAFEGRLVPQNPNDEPAEILLKKIHKDSKKELKFESEGFPKGWIRTKIENISDLIGGGTPSRKIHEYFGGSIPWFTPTEIPKDKISKVVRSREQIRELGLQKSSAKIIPKNSVLLTSRASIGYVAIAGSDVSTNQGFVSFVCNDSIFNYYLAYWLWGNKSILEKNATGTTFKEIAKSVLRRLEIPLPPLPEQHHIVQKIESIFAKIDATKFLILRSLHNIT